MWVIIKHCMSHLEIEPSHESMWLLSIFYLPFCLFLYHAEKYILVYDFTTVFTQVEYKHLRFNTEIFLFAFLLKSILMFI